MVGPTLPGRTHRTDLGFPLVEEWRSPVTRPAQGRLPRHWVSWQALLVVVLALAVMLAAMIALDAESTWLEGATLVALDAIVATAFW
jgi:hypothetical protein